MKIIQYIIQNEHANKFCLHHIFLTIRNSLLMWIVIKPLTFLILMVTVGKFLRDLQVVLLNEGINYKSVFMEEIGSLVYVDYDGTIFGVNYDGTRLGELLESGVVTTRQFTWHLTRIRANILRGK